MNIRNAVAALVLTAAAVPGVATFAPSANAATPSGSNLTIATCQPEAWVLVSSYGPYSVSARPEPYQGEPYACAYAAFHTGVRNIQNHLNARGYHVTVDGFYGPETARVVAAFQRAHKLAADGVVGSATASALGLAYIWA